MPKVRENFVFDPFALVYLQSGSGNKNKKQNKKKKCKVRVLPHYNVCTYVFMCMHIRLFEQWRHLKKCKDFFFFFFFICFYLGRWKNRKREKAFFRDTRKKCSVLTKFTRTIRLKRLFPLLASWKSCMWNIFSVLLLMFTMYFPEYWLVIWWINKRLLLRFWWFVQKPHLNNISLLFP